MTGDRNNASGEVLHATVVGAPPGESPREVPVELAAGSTIGDAVLASGLLDADPLRIERLDLGVFNRPQKPDTPLREGDRVEIYRPLTIDPKEARRIRADVRRRRKSTG
jgi:putative ubiquitin-RnfH superfamily antitoxin RatB of RatAB toxin-antitoxin module